MVVVDCYFRGRLLLLFPSLKVLNFLNWFAPIVPKCEKYPPLVIPVPVILFYWLLPSAVVSVVVPISWFVRLNIFEIVIVF